VAGTPSSGKAPPDGEIFPDFCAMILGQNTDWTLMEEKRGKVALSSAPIDSLTDYEYHGIWLRILNILDSHPQRYRNSLFCLQSGGNGFLYPDGRKRCISGEQGRWFLTQSTIPYT